VLFHYTSAEGLLGIIESKSLWASDPEFLNDARELKYGRDNLRAALLASADQADEAGQAGAEFLDGEYRAKLIRMGARYLDADGVKEERGPTLPAVYVACFCEDGDLLSQWRGYGASGGFAIGFRATAMPDFLVRDKGFTEASAIPDSPPVVKPELVKVGYGHRAVKRMVGGIVDTVPLRRDEGPPGVAGRDMATGVLIPGLASVKQEAFAEEKEWRLIVGGSSREGSFRAGPLGIVPYVHMEFPGDAIAKVIVGPGDHSDLRRSGVERLLLRHDIIRSGAEGECHVTLSEVPFRG
jgi:hypothetical protein